MSDIYPPAVQRAALLKLVPALGRRDAVLRRDGMRRLAHLRLARPRLRGPWHRRRGQARVSFLPPELEESRLGQRQARAVLRQADERRRGRGVGLLGPAPHARRSSGAAPLLRHSQEGRVQLRKHSSLSATASQMRGRRLSGWHGVAATMVPKPPLGGPAGLLTALQRAADHGLTSPTTTCATTARTSRRRCPLQGRKRPALHNLVGTPAKRPESTQSERPEST